MVKVKNNLAVPSAFLTSEARTSRLMADQPVRQQPVFLSSELESGLGNELPPWQPNVPLDDTLTEMEGLARNPNATGAYAGSF